MIPAFAIKADGTDVTSRLQERLIKLRLTDKPGMEADQLEVVFSDHDGALALPRIGATLKVSVGWRGSPLTEKGAYKVDEVVHSGAPDTITVRARSAAFSGSLKEQREQSYTDHTLGDILKIIAERQKLIPSVEAGLASISVPHIDQTNESDANFLTRLGQDYDAIATIKDGRLLFIPVGHPLTVGGRLLTTARIDRGDGDGHRYTQANRDGSVTGVKAKWRDLEESRTRHALAGDERHDGSVKTLKRDFPTEAEALAAARAELNRLNRARREIRLSLAIGRPNIIANRSLSLSGFRLEIDSLSWLAKDVTHNIADGGFTTEVTAQVLP